MLIVNVSGCIARLCEMAIVPTDCRNVQTLDKCWTSGFISGRQTSPYISHLWHCCYNMADIFSDRYGIPVRPQGPLGW